MRYRIEVATQKRKYDGRYVYAISFWVHHRAYDGILFIHAPCGHLIAPPTVPDTVVKLCKYCGNPLDDASLSPFVSIKDTLDVVAAKIARYVESFIRSGHEVDLAIQRMEISARELEDLTKFEKSRALQKYQNQHAEKGLYPWERLKKDLETRNPESLVKMFLA